jgi:hypothetical protein
MDLLFRKQNNTGAWIAAGIGVVAAAAGTLAWFFLRNRRDESNNDHHDPDYMQHRAGRPKKHKSDVSELHTITPAQPEG